MILGALAPVLDDRGIPHLRDARFGLGLAGANSAVLRAAFLAAAPSAAAVSLATDAHTAVLGAHGGAPGAVIAVGTGSVGYRLNADGSANLVGGWGFPVGDEGSGAWLGRRAIGGALRVLGGGGPPPEGLHRALLDHCGPDRDALLAWLHGAPSTKYAELAPMVLEQAGQGDPAAMALARDAGREIDRLALALDRSRRAPLALTGGLAAPLTPYLPAELAGWARPSLGDALDGALLLAKGEAPEERLVQ